MALPFTTGQFFEVFGRYNTSTWPFMILFYVVAVISVYLIYKKVENASKISLGFLAILWLWMGIVYHFAFFSPINKAAYLFGALFIIQGVLLTYATFRQKIVLTIKKDLPTAISLFLVVFALFIYPAIGVFAGHSYPNAPFFGAPCPTTIFTFAIFLLNANRFPRYLLIIPLLWASIGFFAALNLGVPQDIMLLISAAVSSVLIVYKNK